MPMNGERAFELMHRDGVDAIVATSTENVYYVSNHWSIGKSLGCDVEVYTILPIKGSPVLVAPFTEADLVIENRVWIPEIRLYGDSKVTMGEKDGPSEETEALIALCKKAKRGEDGVTTLLTTLEEKGLTDRNLALDMSGLNPTIYEKIKTKLPNAKILDGASLLREIRFVKNDGELERIRTATAITEKSMEDALEIARDEITELDLAGMYGYSVAYDGGRVTQNLIGFGERSAYPNPLPSLLEAKKRDLVRLTLGCTWDHYHSNVSRTAVIGRPLAKAKRVWESVIAAQDAALDTIEPGAKAGEVYSAALKELGESEIKAVTHAIGHGIGTECNELPIVYKGGEMELLEGMVINIDIPLLELGWGGVQLEDTALVTSDGYELLTKTDRALYLLQ